MTEKQTKKSSLVFFISHANVLIAPKVPIPKWHLSEEGILRHQKFNENKLVRGIQTIFCSTEQKAIEGARILANHLNLQCKAIASLGEMDRSSTGYLKKDEFEETVDQFFACPNKSIRGWEKYDTPNL